MEMYTDEQITRIRNRNTDITPAGIDILTNQGRPRPAHDESYAAAGYDHGVTTGRILVSR